MEDFSYIGWIPCINGHLDFGLMHVGIQGGFTNSQSTDNTTIDLNFSRSPHKDSHERFIVLQSKVDWRDSSDYPEDSGKFRIFVTAEVNKSDSMDIRYLSGNVFIYPLSAEPENENERCSMNVHTLSHSIKRDNINQYLNYKHLEKITSSNESISNFNSNYFFTSINFEIDPNGITKLKYNSTSHGFDENSKYLLARQAFYYLKYSIHTHKHHTTKQDSLTTITAVPSSEKKDKSEAGLRLICQLKRELTSIQRHQKIDKKEHATNNAAGIIAYTKSLIQSLVQSDILDKETAKRECVRFENLNDSFSAQTCKRETQLNNSELIKSKSKVVLGFFIISLWGFLNFAYSLEDTNKINIPNSIITFGPFFIASLILVVYGAIKSYYKTMHSPADIESLYHTRIRRFALNMLIGLSINGLLIYFFLLDLLKNLYSIFINF